MPVGVCPAQSLSRAGSPQDAHRMPLTQTGPCWVARQASKQCRGCRDLSPAAPRLLGGAKLKTELTSPRLLNEGVRSVSSLGFRWTLICFSWRTGAIKCLACCVLIRPPAEFSLCAKAPAGAYGRTHHLAGQSWVFTCSPELGAQRKEQNVQRLSNLRSRPHESSEHGAAL